MRPVAFVALLMLSSSGAQSQSPNELAHLYQYDRAAPLDLQQNEIASPGGYKVYSISYAIPHGRMGGFLVTPDRRGRKPGVVWMHSGGSIQFLGNAVLLARAGAVSLLISEAESMPGESAEQIRDR